AADRGGSAFDPHRAGTATAQARSTGRTDAGTASASLRPSRGRTGGTGPPCTGGNSARRPARPAAERWSGPPRTRYSQSPPHLVERLIDTEVGDLEAKRIHPNKAV